MALFDGFRGNEEDDEDDKPAWQKILSGIGDVSSLGMNQIPFAGGIPSLFGVDTTGGLPGLLASILNKKKS